MLCTAVGEQLRAVFLRAAMMSHSCVPNVQLAVDDQLQLTVRASCDIPRAAAIKYNYCELLEVSVHEAPVSGETLNYPPTQS